MNAPRAGLCQPGRLPKPRHQFHSSPSTLRGPLVALRVSSLNTETTECHRETELILPLIPAGAGKPSLPHPCSSVFIRGSRFTARTISPAPAPASDESDARPARASASSARDRKTATARRAAPPPPSPHPRAPLDPIPNPPPPLNPPPPTNPHHPPPSATSTPCIAIRRAERRDTGRCCNMDTPRRPTLCSSVSSAPA